MTPEQFTDYLPKFASHELGVTPPLRFRHVSARFFPLRANLDILQQLCNNLLNKIPVEAGYFRAPLPYVFMAVLDYGQMGEQQMRTGWFSQVEVYFGVPIEWYTCVDGRWVFKDWGVITPYIFVNDDVSVPVGRMVYGFPKILAKVESTPSLWIKDPLAPSTLARISTKVFPEVFNGGKLVSRVFLEVEQATLSNVRVPFDATNPFMPWTIATNLADGYGGFGRDAWWLGQGMRICPIIPSAGGPEIIPAMLERIMRCFSPGQEGFVLNSLNLKQFRREDEPKEICYRSLTNGCMTVTAFNGGGLLGENRVLLGDVSGGFSISLYEHGSLPIAQTLGLEVHSSWTSGGIQVAEFKPVMPHWIDVNLEYDCGTNIAWQSRDGIWKGPSGAPFPNQPPPDVSFNNTVSTVIEAIRGPFQFIGTTIRVIPLLADREKLQDFIDNYGNQALQGPKVDPNGSPAEYEIRFEVWTRGPQRIDDQGSITTGKNAYVYLTATSFESVISESDNVGDWAKYELSFLIPVKFQRRRIHKPGHHSEAWTTVGLGVVPAFTLVDNCITAFTRMEIQGIVAQTARFSRPENVWLDESGAGHPGQTLLRVDVENLPALGEGQTAQFEPLIEISQNDADHGLGNFPEVAAHWARELQEELAGKKATKQEYFADLKIARALSLELLGSEKPFSFYTLKQFRDVQDPNKACYQALVRVPRKLLKIKDVREIEKTLVVRLYGYEPFDVVKELGLNATIMEDRAAGIIYSMQGLRPFYIRATVEEPTAQCLMSRSGTDPWTLHPVAFETMFAGEHSDAIVVDLNAEENQDLADPSQTAARMVHARQRSVLRAAAKKAAKALAADGKTAASAATEKIRGKNDWLKGEISMEVAREAVNVLDAQVVIESILSREWSNHDPNARWRTGMQKLQENWSKLPIDGGLRTLAEKELFRQINNALAARPGAVSSVITYGSLLNPSPKQPDPLCSPDDEEALKSIKGILCGEGAGFWWTQDMKEILWSQESFSKLRNEMERSVDRLSPLYILGIDHANERLQPSDPRLTPEGVSTEIDGLIKVLKDISGDFIKGEEDPGTEEWNDEDKRLKQLLQALIDERQEDSSSASSPWSKVEKDRTHGQEISDIVTLARNKCQRQLDVLLYKLSKAYQKPDYCIRRDAFFAESRPTLVSKAASWDEHWYYGPKITLGDDRDVLAKRVLKRIRLHQKGCGPETETTAAKGPSDAHPQPAA